MKKLLIFLFVLTNILVPWTTFANELDLLSEEQKIRTYYITDELEKNSYDSKITLKLNGREIFNRSVKNLKSKLLEGLNSEVLEDDEQIFRISLTQTKVRKIKNPEIHFFSKYDGKKIITFSCNYLEIGKTKVGPFVIPSKKILFDSPRLIYYK